MPEIHPGYARCPSSAILETPQCHLWRNRIVPDDIKTIMTMTYNDNSGNNDNNYNDNGKITANKSNNHHKKNINNNNNMKKTMQS
jgi:hypothetical protein